MTSTLGNNWCRSLALHAVETYDLGKKFGDAWAVRSATFKINRGSIAVIAGPNGAGKTTTIRMLTTVLKPSKGFGRIMDFDIVREFKEVRKRIAYQPQDYTMFNDVTPEQFIVSTLMMRGESFVRAREEARRWMEELGLSDIKNRRGWILSGGEKRKTVVAATLATGADVVFLDEPTSGVDVEARYSMLKMFRSSARNGVTIVATTHNLVEAQIIADTIIVVHRGMVLFCGSSRELLDRIPYRYRIVASKPDKGLRDLPYIDIGDKIIVWLGSRSEALSIADELGMESFSLEEVSLEDAYLYLIKSLGEL